MLRALQERFLPPDTLSDAFLPSEKAMLPQWKHCLFPGPGYEITLYCSKLDVGSKKFIRETESMKILLQFLLVCRAHLGVDDDLDL